ncbi:hypothetical protein ACHHYP_10113 [Achlya hypogyna]|uniref:Fe2OG dioxygenase domain-containing protein n=1 Tax=Achlya hypogyna TaxID=1202772 RepID=A0A1V9ZI33_ACHHY|nr:hypothetical protein ACHHYP_10113 [Achlya hypogyna]
MLSQEEWVGLTTLASAADTLQRIVASGRRLEEPLRVMGQSALLFAASMYDEDLCLEVLAARDFIPVLINAIDNHGYTALHYAVDADMHAFAKALLASPDIDVRLQTEDLSVVGQIQSGGRTPLHLAVLRNNDVLVKALLARDPTLGGVLDLDGNVPAHLAQLYTAAPAILELLQGVHPVTLLETTALLPRRAEQQALAARRYQLSLQVPANLAMPHVFPRTWSVDECDTVRSALLAKTAVSGWNTTRHTAYPTTDLPSYCLPELDIWVQDSLRTRLFPQILSRFQLDPATALSFRDLFYVKYEASGSAQKDLALHCDGSVLSFNVLLNAAAEFEGGGTYFAPTQTTVHIEQGDVVVHSGRVVHGAAPVSAGTRLILVAFLNVRTPQ